MTYDIYTPFGTYTTHDYLTAKHIIDTWPQYVMANDNDSARAGAL